MIQHGKKFAALAAVGGLLFTGCRDTGGDSKSATAATSASPSATQAPEPAATDPQRTEPAGTTVDTAGETTTPATDKAASEGWTVNVDDCAN